ncbi:hypothetical protein BDZ45DRAFT_802490 [Acephala macrosclerotiorum]|nr:hypothetical protein BDZ45DRAFT_802490 [Acephala macrosclerotiorum]
MLRKVVQPTSTLPSPWQLAQVLGGFPLSTLSADITSLVNDVVTYALGLNLGIDQTLLVGLATQFVFTSNSQIKSKLINDYIVSTQSFEDTTECPPDDRTPYCQNCGGLPSDTICPGDPAANLQFQGCSCLSRPFARPYTPFAKAGGLQVFINILSSLTTLPPPPATSTTQPASSSPVSSATPTPTPDITDTVTCFTRGDGKGANYLSGMNSKNPVTNLCFGADSSTDIKSGASWIPNCLLWWPASAGWLEWCNNGMYIFFNIPADAPPICQTPTPDRGTFCTTPLSSILAVCPNLGGKVNNVCGEWAVQTCPIG